MKKEHKIKRNLKFFLWFKKIGVIKYIFLIYFIVILLISLLLYWPITHSTYLEQLRQSEKIRFNYFDAVFIAASAFSNTGLSTFPISSYLNTFGQALIAISMLLGGLGIFTLKVYIFQTLFGIKLNIFNSEVTQVERGGQNPGQTKRIITVSITFLLITLFITSIVFILIFYLSPYGKFSDSKWAQTSNVLFNPYEKEFRNPKGNLDLSFRYGIFHAISAITNSGFDIIGEKSLAPFNQEYALQLFTLISIFIGGVGYPVIYDVYRKIKSLKITEKNYKITLFTKLTLITYLIVSFFGLLFTFIFELINKNTNGFWKQESYGNNFSKTFAIFFQTFSTRSAGFTTIDYYHFTQQSVLVHSILMFIGFSPASTAGGIRNITVSIIFLSVVSMLLGKRSINVFKRQIGKETFIRAVTIFSIGIILITLSTLICYSTFNLFDFETNKKYEMTHVLFVVCSAFGSCGFDVGLVPSINNFGKIILIALMVIGQLGIQQTLLIWGKNRKRAEYYHYIYEDVVLG
ncbi:TrkH family potassium uptake protein [Metamycoplasma hyosynoviae]|uniref:TrkH family potassium uptake protein n=1 Tax=Metamycoplasma hyosynoviae TaxID=29559 RepID=UPI0023583015|nr:potassium transporter TrkG [Metamycoplasma hyosynoviae]MDC8962863.1 potassium transporter TrkG [Metamycoplasma hyosynoviae]MDD7912247.1 potassium transporter TrkG [Metamycoplasma hyosynoviae]